MMTGVDPDALAFLRHKEVSLELIEEIVPELFGGTFFAQEAQCTGAAFLPEGLFAHVIQARGMLGRTSVRFTFFIVSIRIQPTLSMERYPYARRDGGGPGLQYCGPLIDAGCTAFILPPTTALAARRMRQTSLGRLVPSGHVACV
jgi:hypothetical protein